MGTGWAQLSNNLVYSAIVVYTLAMVAVAAEVAFGRRASSHALTVLAFGLHAGALLTRGVAAGRAPWGNMYEFSLAAGLAATGIYLLLLRRSDVRLLGVLVLPAVLLTVGLAVTVLYTDAGELVPALKSVWLVVHVLAAIVASGAFTVGAALTVLYLVRQRAERRAALSPAFATPAPSTTWSATTVSVSVAAPAGTRSWTARLPAADRLDRLAYQVHAFTFPLWTFAVIAGAIWAENAWGRYWGWDPKETWAFITWVFYAAYLHARATAGWRGGKAASLALLGFASLLINYIGVNLWITGLHSYAGVG